MRLLLGDTNTVDADKQIFDDAEIDAFLSLGDSEVLLASAFGAEGIASSELYVQKVIKIMDLQTDGAKTAAEWRQKAKQWRKAYEDSLDDPDGAFDYAEMVFDQFSARERVAKQALRI